ncbi:hypothetical protein BS78_01G324300 [Paspalum vaginatum]|nr:hypothetical protein BS78_01G324300 [Paspalum vaginatum]
MSPPPPPTSPAPAQLPEDLICCCILPRLPVRSLARFATVCRAWRDLILRNAVFATLQAQSPSPASTALARFHNGRLEVLTPGAAAYVAPTDTSLSFLTARAGYHRLELCACAGGLLCLTAQQTTTHLPVFYVGNLATHRFHRIGYGCPRGVAGLAYDPAAPARGYDVVVAATHGMQTCRFFRFSSRAAGSGWRSARDRARLLAPFEVIQRKPAYAGGRLHWLTDRGNVVWHDVASELSGTLQPPRPSDGHHLQGNMDLAAWRGRVRLACATGAGLGVWELASYGGGKAGESAAARWELVHWRSWCAIPGVAGPERCFLWSVVPAGMEAGGEEALGLALRYAHTTRLVDVGGMAMEQDVWCRVLARYETCTGVTAAAVVLSGKEVHDYFGTVFSYHSSLAPLPCLNMDA